MTIVKSETIVCPMCGHEARVDYLEENAAMYTGEYIDEGEPEIETVKLTGYGVVCLN